MADFRRGDVQASLVAFDAAMAADARLTTRLWQRGLSLYYSDRFEEAAQQFQIDVIDNPFDTEESIWNYLSTAHYRGLDAAKREFITIQGERRPVMREIYGMYQTDDMTRVRSIAMTRGVDGFYAALYLGLYLEASGDSDDAKEWIRAALSNDMASPDYMYAVAQAQSRLLD